MKRLGFLLLCFGCFCLSAVAQGEAKIGCVNFEISGPSELPEQGVPLVYTLQIEEPAKYGYAWTLTGADIVEGQGTHTVRASLKEDAVDVSASVEVLGLPPGCPSKAWETMLVCRPPASILVTEFATDHSRVNRDAFDSLAEALSSNKNDQGFVLLMYEGDVLSGAVRSHEQKIEEYLRRKLGEEEHSRIAVKVVKSDKNFVRLYLVPPGAEWPTH
jgi:hypothetical protein